MDSYDITLEFLGVTLKGELISDDANFDVDLQIFIEERTRKWISLNLSEKLANLEIKFLGAKTSANLTVKFADFIDAETLNQFYLNYFSSKTDLKGLEKDMYELSKEYLYNWFDDNLKISYVKNTNQ